MSSPSPTLEADGHGPLVGVLGAGQLGRMLALAGYPLGLRFLFVDPTPGSPASDLAEQLVLDYDHPSAIERLSRCDVVTYEFESVPAEAVAHLAGLTPVYPPPGALSTAQDRLSEKTCFRELGIPTAPFQAVDSLADLERALAQTGCPALLKTRRLGYDGKGQVRIERPADAAQAFAELGGVPLLLEGFVAFERELSLIGARSTSGELAFYPLVENTHRKGILRRTLSPAPHLVQGLQARAESYLGALFQRLSYVGVLALELFEREGELYANEMAPRVHNSGHHGIEAAETSQFENHLRAILGWPLGGSGARGPAAMLNLIGALPEPAAVLAVPGAHLHLYGKAPRTGRKVGHVTLCAPDEKTLFERLARLEALLPEDG